MKVAGQKRAVFFSMGKRLKQNATARRGDNETKAKDFTLLACLHVDDDSDLPASVSPSNSKVGLIP